jgi:hypothetical protein
MMKLLRAVSAAILSVALMMQGGCLTPDTSIHPEFHDAKFTTSGWISMDYWLQPDGTVILWVSGPGNIADSRLEKEWNDLANRIAKGRKFKGACSIGTFFYKQGYSMVNPYSMGEERKARRAEGTITFIQ